MIDVNAIFQGKKPDPNLLASHGFHLDGDHFQNDFPIGNEQFFVRTLIFLDGKFDFHVYEKESGDEYFLARVQNAEGAFVGQIHTECEKIFSKISKECFSFGPAEEQTQKIFQYILETYRVQPEYLWQKFPDHAVFRAQNGAWFALCAKIERGKIESRKNLSGKKADDALNENERVPILNLKETPENVNDLLSKNQAFPAYHMNKRHWYTVLLGNRLPNEKIFRMIDQSFLMVLKGKTV